MKIWHVAMKDLRLLWRDKFGMFWILVFPLIFALFFGAIFSRSGSATQPMKVAVIDRDKTEGSRAFVKALDDSEAIEIVPHDSPRDAVRKGKLTAYIAIPKGYGASSGFFAANPPELEVGIDPSRKAEAGYLEGLITQASFASIDFNDPDKMQENINRSLKDVEKSKDMDPGERLRVTKFLKDLRDVMGSADFKKSDEQPEMKAVRIKMTAVTKESTGPRSSFEITFPSAVLWGILACAAGFAVMIVLERSGGTLMRLRISPLTRGQILAGKGLSCFLACLGVTVFFLTLAGLVFGVRYDSYLHLAMAAICTSLCFVGFMMLMSVMGKTEQAVAGSGWALITVFAMLGGGMVPLIVMPSWMQTVSHFSPVKWGILALEGAIWRGFTLTEMLLPCGILIGVGFVFYSIGLAIFAKTDS